ncbi:MAG TPA: uracil-DNA glycosylase family protein [bacterium]|nr:uracil-DNA glycosylase family protein [bacterium]
MAALLVRQELAALESEVALCERCFGPERRAAVRFSRPAGEPRVLVLGERPPRSLLTRGERLGPDNPEETMRFLRELLTEANLRTDNVLVGMAAMCRPSSRALEAAVPPAVCLRECSGHVRELIRVAAPRLVVPLGRFALRSLRLALAEEPEATDLRFPESVGRPQRVGERWVWPMYHVTRRARVTRPADRQREDWQRLGGWWPPEAHRA